MARQTVRWHITILFYVFLVGASVPVQAAEFRAVAPGGWGHPLEGGSHVLSHDGRVIAGGIPSPEPGDLQAFRWSPDTGFEWLPLPASHLHLEWRGCKASAINFDGSRILVVCQVDRHDALPGYPVDDLLPFVYENGSYSPWTRIDDEAWPLDMTPFGDMAVGRDFEYQVWDMQHNTRAVRWDTNGQISQLADIDGGNCDAIGADDWHVATAISDDGRVIVGMSGDPSSYIRPVVWVDGAIGLFEGPECGSEWWLNVRELSGNGQFAVGTWQENNNGRPRAIYWSIASPRLGLFLPCSGSFDEPSDAYCISRDGMLIGGRCYNQGVFPGHAVIWDRTTGQDQSVVDLLTDLGLADQIAGWRLDSVERISADGKRISGTGVSPDDLAYIWWADLRDPPDNDNCANAVTLVTNTSPYVMDTQSHSVSGTTRDASSDGGASCASTAHENTDIWYQFTAPVDGYLMLDLCESPLGLLDEYLSVHTACPGTAANEILCRTDCPHRRDCDWPCVEPPELLIPAGQTRYIQVGGWSDEGHEIELSYRFLPLNDDCSDAFSVGHNPSSTPGTTDGMAVDTGANCQGVNATAPGVWYTVLGTGTTMTAATCGEGGDANFDTQISVFCSGCGGQTCVAANDDGAECAGAAAEHSSVSWCSAPGALYHILVHGYGVESGIFELAVTDNGLSCPISINCHPENEECQEAVSVSGGTMISDNTGANTSSISASCAPSTNDVWFHYRTHCDGELWVDTCQPGIGSMSDSVVSLYDGCSGSELACNDDYSDQTVDCERRSAAIEEVHQGQDILIRLAGYGSHQLNQGTFPLRVSEVAAPLEILTTVIPDGFLGVPYAHQLASYGSCGRKFTSATGLPPGLSVDLFSGLVVGTPESAGEFTVHFEVVNNDILNPEWVAADLPLRIWPTNDQCAKALPVSEGLYYFGNAGATTDGPEEPILCTSGWGDPQVASDVWYLYTSSCDGRATIDLCASAYDTKVAVYRGPACPMGEGASACNDDACNLQSRLDIPVAVGAEYLIRIGGYNADQGTGEMLLTCMNDCNGNLVGDSEEIAIGVESDCNFNTRPDSCDVRGDYSADGSVTLQDWPYWLGCLWGPCGPGICSPAAYAEPCCAWIDFDDRDVDLKDLSVFQRELRP